MKQLFLGILFFCLIIYPEQAISGARNGLILWGFTIVPTLLPFFIITNSLQKETSNTKFLLVYLLFLGFFCGYPTVSILISKHFSVNTFTKKQAEFLLFLNQASPVFLINYVHLNYLSNRCSLPIFLLILYLPILFWIVFYVLYYRSKDPSFFHYCIKKNTIPVNENKGPFIDSIYTIVNIGCFIVIFSIFITFSIHFFRAFCPVFAILSCFLEITTGLSFLSAYPLNWQIKTALMASLCSCGGLCSLFQIKGILPKELSIVPYVIFKCLTALTTFLLTLLIF